MSNVHADVPPGFTSTVFKPPVVNVTERKKALETRLKSDQESLEEAKAKRDERKYTVVKDDIENVKAALKDYNSMSTPPTCKMYYQFGKRVYEHEVNRKERFSVRSPWYRTAVRSQRNGTVPPL